MNILAVVVIAVVDLTALAGAGAYLLAFRRAGARSTRNVRLFVLARVAELCLFALILTMSAAFRSPWLLVAMVVPLLLLPLARRTLKRRELDLLTDLG